MFRPLLAAIDGGIAGAGAGITGTAAASSQVHGADLPLNNDAALGETVGQTAAGNDTYTGPDPEIIKDISQTLTSARKNFEAAAQVWSARESSLNKQLSDAKIDKTAAEKRAAFAEARLSNFDNSAHLRELLEQILAGARKLYPETAKKLKEAVAMIPQPVAAAAAKPKHAKAAPPAAAPAPKPEVAPAAPAEVSEPARTAKDFVDDLKPQLKSIFPEANADELAEIAARLERAIDIIIINSSENNVYFLLSPFSNTKKYPELLTTKRMTINEIIVFAELLQLTKFDALLFPVSELRKLHWVLAKDSLRKTEGKEPGYVTVQAKKRTTFVAVKDLWFGEKSTKLLTSLLQDEPAPLQDALRAKTISPLEAKLIVQAANHILWLRAAIKPGAAGKAQKSLELFLVVSEVTSEAAHPAYELAKAVQQIFKGTDLKVFLKPDTLIDIRSKNTPAPQEPAAPAAEPEAAPPPAAEPEVASAVKPEVAPPPPAPAPEATDEEPLTVRQPLPEATPEIPAPVAPVTTTAPAPAPTIEPPAARDPEAELLLKLNQNAVNVPQIRAAFSYDINIIDNFLAWVLADEARKNQVTSQSERKWQSILSKLFEIYKNETGSIPPTVNGQAKTWSDLADKAAQKRINVELKKSDSRITGDGINWKIAHTPGISNGRIAEILKTVLNMPLVNENEQLRSAITNFMQSLLRYDTIAYFHTERDGPILVILFKQLLWLEKGGSL